MSSIVRQFLMWWFAPPESPWVCGNFSIDVTTVQAYLTRINEQNQTRVSLHNFISAAVARALKAVPQANSRIFGHQIVPQEDVGIAMPVNLIGHEGGGERELSMMVIEQVDKKSLVELAKVGRNRKDQERKGKMQNSFLAGLLKVFEKLPSQLNRRFLNRLDQASKNSHFAQKIFEHIPVTAAITNPGSTHPSDLQGVLFRGGSFHPPQRIAHVGTFWGITGIQNEVIPIDGQPQIRPMLPVMLIFDHRLIDGVKASELSFEFIKCFQEPEVYFGADGGMKP
ncbi:MAG: hypothetical protein CMK59_01090 [Proteobacteria bacterium]|nr:hypothetical protein [Pseudomonadota bacterium]